MSCTEPARLQRDKWPGASTRACALWWGQQGPTPGSWSESAETAEHGDKSGDKAQEGADI